MGCYQRNGCLCGASDASESIGCEGQGHDEEVFASAVHREGERERETERGERDMMKRNSHPEGISQTLRWLEWLSKGNGWQPMHKLIWGNSIERKAVRLSKEDMQGRTGKGWLDKKMLDEVSELAKDIARSYVKYSDSQVGQRAWNSAEWNVRITK